MSYPLGFVLPSGRRRRHDQQADDNAEPAQVVLVHVLAQHRHREDRAHERLQTLERGDLTCGQVVHRVRDHLCVCVCVRV